MAPSRSPSRFVRFLRSICAPATAVIGFSFLLTFLFILYQPTRGPGSQQRVGWQAWDVISPPEGGSQVEVTPTTGSSDTHGGVDWWNVTQPGEDSVDYASFPLDVWAPLLPHDTGRKSIGLPCYSLDPSAMRCSLRIIHLTVPSRSFGRQLLWTPFHR